MTEDDFQAAFDRRLSALLGLVDAESHPKLNPLAIELRDLRILALNIKFFGYELARRVAEALPPRKDLKPVNVGLRCKPSTQADLESEWASYWCQELKTPVVFHRKLWELAYVLQALHEADMLRPDARGLGFGCGEEPIASYLAARGAEIVVTDLAPETREAKGWVETGQHAKSLETVFQPHLVGKEVFEAKVRHRFVDMNAIPQDLRDFDFCWSICALEHLGSIENGMNFVVKAMQTLRPGGIAVHTTEFNFLDGERTLDNWPTVLFQRRHFELLSERLRGDGHKLAPLDFDVGTKPLDRFIDIPPYAHDWPDHLRNWGAESPHLKLSIDGIASTCFGLIIVKA